MREIGPGFFNIRGHFKMVANLVDIGTHMSLLRLSNGKFLVIDTIPLTDQIKADIDALTNNGENITAVLATHPFHTLSFAAFYTAYPKAAYYGTPRHLKRLVQIPWQGSLDDCKLRDKWSPEVEMRIPAGAEFVEPLPEKSNHFSCVFVFHRASKTLHVDDTIMYSENPGFLLKLAGFKKGSMSFHPSIKGVGLYPHPDAPFAFRDFIKDVLKDWNFDNLCAAHLGAKIGGAHTQLKEVLDNAEKLFNQLSEKKKKSIPADETPEMTVNGVECG